MCGCRDRVLGVSCAGVGCRVRGYGWECRDRALGVSCACVMCVCRVGVSCGGVGWV